METNYLKITQHPKTPYESWLSPGNRYEAAKYLSDLWETCLTSNVVQKSLYSEFHRASSQRTSWAILATLFRLIVVSRGKLQTAPMQQG